MQYTTVVSNQYQLGELYSQQTVCLDEFLNHLQVTEIWNV
jgi:hypothetical protein